MRPLTSAGVKIGAALLRKNSMCCVRLLVACVLATPALAANDSAYSELKIEDAKNCKRITPASQPGEGENSGIFQCKGHGDLAVAFAEDDLRSFVGFGKKPRNTCAFRQTFAGFNSVEKKIEWRLKDGVPIATIFRWSVSYDPEDASKQKSWLVVTRLGDANSCHIGYVEGGYPNANDKARQLADTEAENFSCSDGVPTFFVNADTTTEGMISGSCED
jgi:hypothetical protein